MHLKTGHLNYISNSNLDFNNPMNNRRFGAYAGIDYNPMAGIAIRQNPKTMQFDGSFAGIAVDNMAGIMDTAKEQAMDKPFLWGGIALIALPSVKNSMSKKKMSKKAEKKSLYLGLGAIAWHFLSPMLAGDAE
jgi:hypothetical protein